jgi:hypothetical protein
LGDEDRGFVVLVSACAIAPYHSLESAAFLAPQNNINQLVANDSFNQCDEQTTLLKHEIALCRAVLRAMAFESIFR